MKPFTITAPDYQFFAEGINKFYNGKNPLEFTTNQLFKFINKVKPEFNDWLLVKNAITKGSYTALPEIGINHVKHFSSWPFLGNREFQKDCCEYFSKRGVNLYSYFKEAFFYSNPFMGAVKGKLFIHYMDGIQSGLVVSKEELEKTFEYIVAPKTKDIPNIQDYIYVVALECLEAGVITILPKLEEYCSKQYMFNAQRNEKFEKILDEIEQKSISVADCPTIAKQILFKDSSVVERVSLGVELNFDCLGQANGNVAECRKIVEIYQKIGKFYYYNPENNKKISNDLPYTLFFCNSNLREASYQIFFKSELSHEQWKQEFQSLYDFALRYEGGDFQPEEHIERICLENRLQNTLPSKGTGPKKRKI